MSIIRYHYLYFSNYIKKILITKCNKIKIKAKLQTKQKNISHEHCTIRNNTD